MFGNDDTGKAIAELHIRVLRKTSASGEIARSEAGKGAAAPGRKAPILAITGSRIIAATVCETNVVTARTHSSTAHSVTNGGSVESCPLSPPTIISNILLSLAHVPSIFPPARRNMRCHDSLLKSSFLRIPQPKKTTRGMRATTPASPKMFLPAGSTQRMIVASVVATTMWTWMRGTGGPRGLFCSGMLSMPSKGRHSARIRPHAATTPAIAKGRVVSIHFEKVTSELERTCIATAFCGLEMGLSIPPMLQLKASASKMPWGAEEPDGNSHSVD